MYPKVFQRRAGIVSEALNNYFWKVTVEEQQNIHWIFFKYQISCWSFRQKGKIHEVGVLRTKRRGKYLQLVCDRHCQTEHLIQSSTCKPGLGSSHLPDQETRPQEAEENCPRAAARPCLIWNSTPVSALLWQGPCLTIFIALLHQGLTNWTQPSLETKELWDCIRLGLLNKKAPITAHKHDSFSTELWRQWMKRSQNDLIWTTITQKHFPQN